MAEAANWRKQKVQIRRGTTAEWTARNTLLLAGELGYEYDTNKLKVGDGVTRWAGLQYLNTTGALSGLEDVVATDVADGSVLRYSAGAWRPYEEDKLVDGGNFG